MRRSQLETQRNALLESGAELEPEDKPFEPPEEDKDVYADPAFEPMLIIAGAVAIAYLAERIAEVIKDHRHGGLIVDARAPGKVIIREHPGLKRGTALTLLPNGREAEFDSTSRSDLSAVITALGSGNSSA
jgi:hypothetical protein